MGHADIDYVREASNAVVDRIKVESGVMVRQHGLQFTHGCGIIICIIEGEISDLETSQYTTIYENITDLTFSSTPASKDDEYFDQCLLQYGASSTGGTQLEPSSERENHCPALQKSSAQ